MIDLIHFTASTRRGGADLLHAWLHHSSLLHHTRLLLHHTRLLLHHCRLGGITHSRLHGVASGAHSVVNLLHHMDFLDMMLLLDGSYSLGLSRLINNVLNTRLLLSDFNDHSSVSCALAPTASFTAANGPAGASAETTNNCKHNEGASSSISTPRLEEGAHGCVLLADIVAVDDSAAVHLGLVGHISLLVVLIVVHGVAESVHQVPSAT